MVLTVGFVKARLRATESFQRTVAARWVWLEKTLAQWAADLVAFPAKELLLKGFLQDLAVKRGSVDAKLEHLHNLTVLGLQMARAKYRRNPAILASLKGLDSTDSGRQDIIDDATAWHLAWQRLPEDDQDKVCSVRTRRVRPIAGFATLLADAQTEFTALKQLEDRVRTERAELAAMAANLWQDCVEWYMAALAMFPEETPEGQNLRAAIPTATTYVPETDEEGSTVPEIPGDDAPSGVTTR